jgi:translation initiation factor eIF-2B subunit beta
MGALQSAGNQPLNKEVQFAQVIVAEAAPTYEGQRMACELAALGIQTTAITDSAIYAMMARVNKARARGCKWEAHSWTHCQGVSSNSCSPVLNAQVVVTAHALLADGGIMAPIGMHLVAMAAKDHAVPVVVLCGIYKLTPLFAHEPGLNFNELKSPASILPYTDEAMLTAGEPSAERMFEKGKGSCFVICSVASAVWDFCCMTEL